MSKSHAHSYLRIPRSVATKSAACDDLRQWSRWKRRRASAVGRVELLGERRNSTEARTRRESAARDELRSTEVDQRATKLGRSPDSARKCCVRQLALIVASRNNSGGQTAWSLVSKEQISPSGQFVPQDLMVEITHSYTFSNDLMVEITVT